MPSKIKKNWREAFDSIVFLAFVALLSIAAAKANSWERSLCETKVFAKKVEATPRVIVSVRGN